MKIIQVYSSDGSREWLFKYTDRDDIQEDIRECLRKAKMAFEEIVPEEGEEEYLDDIFINYLHEDGIERVFIEEEMTIYID